MSRAIAVDLPKPPQRYVNAKYLEPGTDPNKIVSFARYQGGLNTPYSLTMNGDYTFRFRAYANKVGGEEAKASVTVDGNEVKSIAIPGGEDKTAKTWEIKVPLTKGIVASRCLLFNPARTTNQNERSMWNGSIWKGQPTPGRKRTRPCWHATPPSQNASSN